MSPVGGGVGEELAAAPLAFADDGVRADRRRDRQRHDDHERREEVDGQRVRRLHLRRRARAAGLAARSGRLPTTSLELVEQLRVLRRSRSRSSSTVGMITKKNSAMIASGTQKSLLARSWRRSARATARDPARGSSALPHGEVQLLERRACAARPAGAARRRRRACRRGRGRRSRSSSSTMATPLRS